MSSRLSFEAIGTHWTIDLYRDISKDKELEIEGLVRARIEEFEQTYSRFRADSWLSSWISQPGTYELPHDAVPLFTLYHELYSLTDGLVTPLVGQVLSDAGYDKDYSFKQRSSLSQAPEWDDVIDFDPGNASVLATMTIKKPASFDVGALGKGYIIDIVAALLEQNGIDAYCVDAGGDMKHKGTDGAALRVALEDPQDMSNAVGVITLGDKCIAGSAGNRRKWGKFNHIINPKTLVSPDHILGVWVVADTTMLADAMATALYFSPAEALLKKYAFDYLVLRDDRSVEGTLSGNPMVELF